MRLFTYPSQDASIFEEVPTRNTGLDEILEVGKTSDGSYRTRTLIQFNVTTISASLASGVIPANAQFDLTLYVSNGDSVSENQSIELYSVSGSWDEGVGYYYQDSIQSPGGVTWINARTGSVWHNPGSDVIDLIGTTVLSNPLTDVTFDVSSIVTTWISGTLPNNGMELQFATASESSAVNWGNVKFFSKDTHTIYRPVLVAKWNDQIINAGPLSASVSTDLLVIPATLKPSYHVNEMARVNLAARKRYPLKTFSTQFTQYNGLNYLPSSSFYSIIDDLSGTTIIPFDDNSRISCDSEGSYFIFKVQNMYPQRYYRVMVRVDHDGVSDIFDDGYFFTVK